MRAGFQAYKWNELAHFAVGECVPGHEVLHSRNQASVLHHGANSGHECPTQDQTSDSVSDHDSDLVPGALHHGQHRDRGQRRTVTSEGLYHIGVCRALCTFWVFPVHSNLDGAAG